MRVTKTCISINSHRARQPCTLQVQISRGFPRNNANRKFTVITFISAGVIGYFVMNHFITVTRFNFKWIRLIPTRLKYRKGGTSIASGTMATLFKIQRLAYCLARDRTILLSATHLLLQGSRSSYTRLHCRGGKSNLRGIKVPGGR